MFGHSRLCSLRLVVLSGFIWSVTRSAHAEFGHGHLFVSQSVGEACRLRTSWIRAIDPNPAAPQRYRTIADSDDRLCFPGSMAFSPDRDVLCVMNIVNFVTQHRPDGSATIRYDRRHGLQAIGHGIAFDALGDCYITDQTGIVRLSPDGKIVTIFGEDRYGFGRGGSGPLAFAPNGDLYQSGRWLYRFDRRGRWEFIDETPPSADYAGFSGLAINRQGTVFVHAWWSVRLPTYPLTWRYEQVIYRYENGQRDQRSVLRSGAGLGGTLVFSPDERLLYTLGYSDGGYFIYEFDPVTGDGRETYRFTDDPMPDIAGLTVYSRFVRGDCNCDSLANFDDIAAFVLALVSDEAYATTHGTCYIGRADCNRDGRVDFDDIPAFVECITYGCPGVD